MFVLLTSHLAVASSTKIIKDNGKELTLLDPSLQNYIRQNFPNYSPPTMADKIPGYDWSELFPPDQFPPVFAEGDFNGDGKEDAALYLKGKQDALAVAFHAGEKGEWKHYLLDRVPLSRMNSYGMDKIDRREKRIPWPQGIKQGIVFSTFETGMQVFYWNKTGYDSFVVGD